MNTMTQTPLLQPAKKGTRLSNLIVDTILFNLIIMAHAFAFDWMGNVVPEEGSNWLGVYYFVLYFAYYFLFEWFFNKSPAKFITATKVVSKHGGKPSLKEILIRSLCRLIPFDGLSYIFSETGWHDALSHTMVVDN
ncbi:MAG: RDD family protein [Flavobacterium psychrophilum]|nr:MAG: RDD family protein [Flavobacterium psychrophilum]